MLLMLMMVMVMDDEFTLLYAVRHAVFCSCAVCSGLVWSSRTLLTKWSCIRCSLLWLFVVLERTDG